MGDRWSAAPVTSGVSRDTWARDAAQLVVGVADFQTKW